MRFEIDHLASYDDEALLDELRRVSSLVPTQKLTRTEFEKHARVHPSTLGKRFGSWHQALSAAGLAERFDDSAFAYDRDEILVAIQSVAARLNRSTITLNEFKAHTGIDGGPVRRIFGNWAGALGAAGLSQSVLARRYTDEQCYENLLALWIHYGRAPKHDEMNHSPSTVGAKAYIRRWGTWRKALAAFVARANDPDLATTTPQSTETRISHSSETEQENLSTTQRGRRDVPLALRYYVLKRDRFRCVTCGKSPAIDPGTVLHIDHTVPWAAGGATVAENLRVLCMNCNLGKGVSHAEEV